MEENKDIIRDTKSMETGEFRKYSISVGENEQKIMVHVEKGTSKTDFMENQDKPNSVKISLIYNKEHINYECIFGLNSFLKFRRSDIIIPTEGLTEEFRILQEVKAEIVERMEKQGVTWDKLS